MANERFTPPVKYYAHDPSFVDNDPYIRRQVAEMLDNIHGAASVYRSPLEIVLPDTQLPKPYAKKLGNTAIDSVLGKRFELAIGSVELATEDDLQTDRAVESIKNFGENHAGFVLLTQTRRLEAEEAMRLERVVSAVESINMPSALLVLRAAKCAVTGSNVAPTAGMLALAHLD